jgi:hypothetical protein
MSTLPNKPSRRTFVPVWWIASILFHALLLGWLFFLSPVRVIDLTTRPDVPAAHISPERAAKVMAQVREKQAETMAGEVRALEEARRELATLEARKRDELRQGSTHPPPPIEKVAAAQDNAIKAQAVAVAALKQANEQLPPGATDLSVLTNVTIAIQAAQTNAGQFQAEALEALALADPKFEPAYQAQAEANAAQSRAAQAQAEAEGQMSGAAALRSKNAPKGDDLEEAKEMLAEAEAQLAKATSNSIALSNSLPQLHADAAAAQAAYAAAQAGGDKATIDRTKQPARTTQKAADTAQKDLTRALSDIPKFQSRVTNQIARIAKFSGHAGPPGLNPAAMQQGAVEKLREAQRLQTEAATAQSRAVKAFADARAEVPAPPPASANVGEDLAGTYQAAVRTEAELVEAYRRLRATDLAMQRQIPLARALELTDAARSTRPDLAPALRGSPASATEAAAQRQAMMEARAQLMAMRSLADSMLAQARGLNAGPSQYQTLEHLAAEDENQRAKDLTGAMRGGAGSGSGRMGSGSGRSGSGGSAAGGGSGGSGGTGNGSGGSGSSGGGGAGSGFGLGGSGDGTSSGPPPVSKDLASMPGRVIGAAAVPKRWMYVDSWYLLGPFDNAGRANLEKQFPPETVVDLNATYVGKRGRPIRWDFHQSPQPRIAPPFDAFNPLASGAGDGGAGAFKARDLEYIIYYGYTELRAEQACDVWIAIGSDDFSKLWIEDQLVWASGKNHKSWRIDEGFRKVRLQQGINRLLFRVENGHSQSEFSLALCVE